MPDTLSLDSAGIRTRRLVSPMLQETATPPTHQQSAEASATIQPSERKRQIERQLPSSYEREKEYEAVLKKRFERRQDSEQVELDSDQDDRSSSSSVQEIGPDSLAKRGMGKRPATAYAGPASERLPQKKRKIEVLEEIEVEDEHDGDTDGTATETSSDGRTETGNIFAPFDGMDKIRAHHRSDAADGQRKVFFNTNARVVARRQNGSPGSFGEKESTRGERGTDQARTNPGHADLQINPTTNPKTSSTSATGHIVKEVTCKILQKMLEDYEASGVAKGISDPQSDGDDCPDEMVPASGFNELKIKFNRILTRQVDEVRELKHKVADDCNMRKERDSWRLKALQRQSDLDRLRSDETASMEKIQHSMRVEAQKEQDRKINRIKETHGKTQDRLENEVKDLKTKLAQSQQELKAAKADHKADVKEIKAAHKQEMTDYRPRAKQSVRETQKECKALQEIIDKAKFTCSKLENKNRSLKEDNERVTEQREKLRADINDLEQSSKKAGHDMLVWKGKCKLREDAIAEERKLASDAIAKERKATSVALFEERKEHRAALDEYERKWVIQADLARNAIRESTHANGLVRMFRDQLAQNQKTHDGLRMEVAKAIQDKENETNELKTLLTQETEMINALREEQRTSKLEIESLRNAAMGATTDSEQCKVEFSRDQEKRLADEAVEEMGHEPETDFPPFEDWVRGASE